MVIFATKGQIPFLISMPQFLKLVAEDIYARFANNLENITIVFPSKRPEYYFYRYLGQVAGKEILAPKILTFRELIESWSELTAVSNLELIYRLFPIYQKHVKNTETFDQFYFWGELILSDFDEIDRNLAEPEKVFALVTQIKQLEDVFTDPEVARIVGRFWETVYAGQETELKKRFLDFWKSLLPIYRDFNLHLSENGLAYEGKIWRQVARKWEDGEAPVPDKQFAFVGFDFLSKAEKAVLKSLRKNQKALFYWDYDESFLDTKYEAGKNINEYLGLFPSTLDSNKFRNFRTSKSVSTFDTPGLLAVAQASLTKTFENHEKNNTEPDVTALVLADENLLLPVLSSLPAIDNVNVTMGWPIKFSNPATLVMHLTELWLTATKSENEVKYAAKSLLKIAGHCWISASESQHIKHVCEKKIYVNASDFETHQTLSDLLNLKESTISIQLERILSKYFTCNAKENNSKEYQARIDEESVHHLKLHLNQYSNVVSMFNLRLEMSTQLKLINKLINTISVPFEGSPLSGVQITNLQETRCLDFSNVIIAGANEGVLPSTQNRISHIPFSIRKAFGLTTPDDNINREAYLLYRLMERAENVSFVTNTDEQEMDKPEVSRFVQQFKLEQTWDFRPQITHSYHISTKYPKPIAYPWDAKVREFMHRFCKPGQAGLSPSAINTYIDCPLKFYLKYPCQLTEPIIETEVMDNRVFGNLLHQTIEKLYKGFENNIAEKTDFETIMGSGMIEKAVNSVYENMHEINSQPGYNHLFKDIVTEYIKQIVKLDSENAPIHFLGLEKKITGHIEIETPQGSKTVNLKGTIDRIDNVNGTIRILDYKTGKPESSVDADLNNVFDASINQRKQEALQAFLYAMLYNQTLPLQQTTPIISGLIVSRKVSEKGIMYFYPLRNPKEKIYLADIVEIFRQKLTTVLSNMFDETKPFVQTENDQKCRICSFKEICQR